MNKVLSDNIIIFYFCLYCYKSKTLDCQEDFFFLIIKKKEQEEIVKMLKMMKKISKKK